MDYNFTEIEKKWQQYWRDNKIYKVDIDHSKPKFYVLDMFPYPSGAGLHVGHPLGYIASDIYARYKRLKGFNVLHPMGYDAYGLPAEQYAIQTGTHPAVTTEKNINRYREQMDKIGFCYDWDREVRTCEPGYYKWTQWTFLQLFNSFYCNGCQKAQPISKLIARFEEKGTEGLNVAESKPLSFTAAEWKAMSEKQQQEVLMNYRLAYQAEAMVNWCPGLGTVLANDEVADGLSVRGGFPVERKSMKQWQLRITAYADRLLQGLETVDWSESVKDLQRNWIGKSMGASVIFKVDGKDIDLEVFTTRADTLFGTTFMVLAPEHELVKEITTPEQRAEVEEYITRTKNRSERERMAEVRKVSGAFTGAYGINPITGAKLPIWIADYVLMGYGTGAIMAVPAHDSRDFAFASHFNLPIIQVVKKPGTEATDPSTWEESFDAKDGELVNLSGFCCGAMSARARPTTACAMPSSAASVIGASHSRSIIRTACLTPWTSRNFRLSCLPSANISLPRRVSRLWLAPRTGSPRKAIPSRPTPCLVLLVPAVIISATKTRTTTRNTSAAKPTTIGRMSTSISVALNMPLAT